MPKVCIISPNHQYREMFRSMGWEVVTSPTEADVIQFTGGEDVSPSYYGEQPHYRTGHNPHRDKYEKGVFDSAVKAGKPMIGICRGGQFLNVMCGGAMWQHVHGHAIHGTHPCIDNETQDIIEVTSTHHQMIRPSEGGLILAQAYEAEWLECVRDGEVVRVARDDKYPADVEAVFYPTQKVLCFQPHPEFPGYDECRDYYFHLINRHLGLMA